jgi:hypothetical protein
MLGLPLSTLHGFSVLIEAVIEIPRAFGPIGKVNER